MKIPEWLYFGDMLKVVTLLLAAVTLNVNGVGVNNNAVNASRFTIEDDSSDEEEDIIGGVVQANQQQDLERVCDLLLLNEGLSPVERASLRGELRNGREGSLVNDINDIFNHWFGVGFNTAQSLEETIDGMVTYIRQNIGQDFGTMFRNLCDSMFAEDRFTEGTDHHSFVTWRDETVERIRDVLMLIHICMNGANEAIRSIFIGNPNLSQEELEFCGRIKDDFLSHIEKHSWSQTKIEEVCGSGFRVGCDSNLPFCEKTHGVYVHGSIEQVGTELTYRQMADMIAKKVINYLLDNYQFNFGFTGQAITMMINGENHPVDVPTDRFSIDGAKQKFLYCTYDPHGALSITDITNSGRIGSMLSVFFGISIRPNGTTGMSLYPVL